MTTHSLSASSVNAGALRTVLAAVFVTMLGAFFVYGVGFAGPELIHNAAHDGRHAMSFPCH